MNDATTAEAPDHTEVTTEASPDEGAAALYTQLRAISGMYDLMEGQLARVLQ